MGVPWYLSWVLDRPRNYWPEWARRRFPAKGTIECKVWHRDRRNAAKVMREYIREALLDAWGMDYNIIVNLHTKSVPDHLSDDGVFGYVRDHPQAAKDVNAICLPHTDAVGGGSTCKFSVDTPWDKNPDVDSLWSKPNTGKESMKVKTWACGKPHNLISSGLHEVGHCLGLGHNIGGEIEHNNQRYATPMPYSSLDCYYLRYSTEATNYSIDVE